MTHSETASLQTLYNEQAPEPLGEQARELFGQQANEPSGEFDLTTDNKKQQGKKNKKVIVLSQMLFKE